MSIIPDEKLFEYSARAKGKVVLITGGANGIGKETALKFAYYGAKLVIGDLDTARGEQTVKEIKQAGGQAVFQKCNVVQWEDQVALFDLAIATHGVVDIVIPNAGVTELGTINTLNKAADGKLLPPDLTTLQVNLIGATYTVNLASRYLSIKYDPETSSLKALILIGSMASWMGVSGAPLYTASKHAILGIMRGCEEEFVRKGIRIAAIHPWFADTLIVPLAIKAVLAGIPMAPIPRIAGTIFCAATNPDPTTNGCAWLIPDGEHAVLLSKEEFKMGVYKAFDDRVNSLYDLRDNTTYYFRLASDATRLLGMPLMKTGLIIYAAKLAWNHQDTIYTYVRDLVGS